MAIPFNLPSDEETENNYRSMDDLLIQLYQVIRQILIRRAPVADADQHRHGRVPHLAERHEVDAVPPPDVVPRLPLPDVVSCSTPALPASCPSSLHPRPPPRRPRRRRQHRRQDRVPDDAPEKEVAIAREEETPMRKVQVRDNWTQVGEDLRQIADEFSTSLQDIEPKSLDTSSNQKGLRFLSLLVPPPFRGSIWLAMIFLFGWGALRSR